MKDRPRAPAPTTTATLVRDQVPRPLGAIVRVVGATASPQATRLDAGTCVIGSATGADVVVRDATVSRSHVELRLEPSGIRVTDLGSHNGTFYLGQRIQSLTLALGGRIEIGRVEVRIDADTDALRTVAPYEGDTYRGMCGTSLAMRRLFATLVRLEGSLVTVLVSGPSGVGKELVARALHAGSGVSEGPLVVVNCGTTSRELVASELFGHRKGAFTGAVEARRGAFELADGGTLFLDEIGELPLDVQPMLLRALETGDVRPIGAEQSFASNVRVVAATNRDLAAEVAEGRFREDLFYRLAVVRLEVPPLRDRPDDIEPLARDLARQLGIGALPAAVIEEVRTRHWRGNVRELRNALRTYAALGALPADTAAPGAGASELDVALASFVDVGQTYGAQKDDLVERFTRAYLQAVVEKAGGNHTAAARMAGLNRTYFSELLAKAKAGLTKG